MYILALVTDAFGGHGGIAAYNRNFLSSLADGGASISVLPRLGTPDKLPARIDQLAPRRPVPAYIMAALGLALSRRPFDLIWCGHLRMLPLAHILSRMLGCPVWLQVHGIDAWDRPPPIIKRAADQCRMITAVSRYTRMRLLEWSDIAPERVRILQNCLDQTFSPGPRRQELLDRYDIAHGPVLLTISRLSAAEGYKGQDRVLRLLPALAQRFPGLVYVIGGDGDDRPRLEALAAEFGVAAHCRFIRRVPADELVDHYRLADLFVMPSTQEGFGIVYLEAMACGVPAVGLDVDGSVDPLTACSLGHAVPKANLGKTITEILTDPPRRPERVPEDLAPFSTQAFSQRVLRLAREVAR